MAGPVRLQLLGEVGIVGADGDFMSLSSSQSQIAAARLVLERRRSGTSRRELASTIWPDELPDTWASALRSVITRVRRLVEELGPEASLESVGGRYILRLPCAVRIDLEDALHGLAQARDDLAAGRLSTARALAAAAISAFGNGFLRDHESTWANTVHQQLADALADAHDIAARAALADGDPAAALVSARALIESAPLRESGYRSMMEAHLDAGNRAESLAVYARLRSILSDELGIDPAPETEDVYFRMLSAGSDDSRAPESPRAHGAPTRPFVARGGVITELVEIWRAVIPGSPALTLITGELGLGKTSVANEFARTVMSGGTAVVACVGRATDRRRSAIVDAVAQLLPTLTSSVRLQVEPVLGDAQRALTDDSPIPIGPLVSVICRVARGGALVLIIDDVDEVDQTTLEVLHALFLRDPAAQPCGLFVLATAEKSRLDSTALRFLHEIEREGSVRRIDLPRFGLVDAHEFISTLPAVAQENAAQLGRLLTASGGNPYLLARLVETDSRRHDLLATLVGGLRDYTRIRTADLAPSSARFLRVAAVAGPAFDAELVARAAEVHINEIALVLDELVRSELISADDVSPCSPEGLRPEEYRFLHGAICDTVYSDLPKTERVRFHRRLAEELGQRGSLVLPESHRVRGPWGIGAISVADSADPAIESRWHAAEQATDNGDLDGAIRLRRDALDLVPPHDESLRARALSLLGVDELRAGSPHARMHLMEATMLGLGSNAVGVALAAASRLVDDLAIDPSLADDARSTCQQVLDSLRLLGLPALAEQNIERPLARFLARHVRFEAGVVEPDLMRRSIGTLTELTEEVGDPLQAGTRIELARELGHLARRVGDPEALVLSAHHGASGAAIRQCPDETREFDGVWAEAMRMHPTPEKYTHLWAERHLVAATNGVRSAQPSVSPPIQGRDIASALAGDLLGRQRLVARWLGFRNPDAWSSSTSSAHGLRAADAGLSDVLAGRASAARSRLRMMLSAGGPFAVDDASLHDAAVMAIIAVDSSEPDLIGQVREKLQPFALVSAAHGYRTSVGPVSFHLARLAMAEHDLDDAERLLISGLTTVSRARSRVWVAVHQLGIAAILDRRRTSGDAVAAQAFREEARRIIDPRIVSLSVFDAV